MPINPETSALIRKYAIKNAFDYGKADIGSVLGKAIQDAKGTPVPELKEEVEKTVSKINKMKRPELEKEYAPFAAEFERKAEQTVKKTEKPRLEIEGAVDGKVVTRLSPAPSGYMHIGHMKQAILSSEIAKHYNGKFYRYFDDTDPEKCKQIYVDAMMEDHEWLGLVFDKTYYASDFVDSMYPYAMDMIKKGNAYVCMCAREQMKELRFNGKECVHRKQPAKENSQLFDDMLKGKYGESQATLRYKGDMQSQNTIMRDPVLLRIVETPHYRTGDKYKVWPVYDFNTPIVDSNQGVTDIIRSKEYELHDELSKQILTTLGLRVPRMHLEARLNIKGNTTHKRIITKLIEDGKLDGFDDPRLMTIRALRRRGIMPQAIRNFVLKLGMTKTDSTVPLDMLLAENKRVIDPIAKHMFFVNNPVKLTVSDAGSIPAKMKLHPSNELGFREYETGNVFFVSKSDAESLKAGDTIRLKDLIDVKINAVGKSITAEKSSEGKGSKIIQWVSDGNYAKCTILVAHPIFDENENFNPNSLETVSGYVESYAARLNEREIVQFERFGYCTLDEKKSMQFIFISK
jgi:glutamyl-tRNA synthetase